MNNTLYIKFILLIAIILFAPLKGHSQFPQHLSYTEEDDIGMLNPYEFEMPRNASIRLFSLLFEPLYRYNFDEESYKSVLVESERRTGQNQYSFRLVDANWHDGEALTASDVKFTYEYVLEHGKNEVVRNRIKNGITDISIISDREFSIRFADGVTQVKSILTQFIMPKHALDGDSAVRQQFARSPIGTGPFVFEDRGRQGRVSLSRFEDYHSELPKIENIGLRRVSDPSTRISGLLAGQTDLLVEVPFGRLQDVESRLRHQIEPYHSISINTIIFNFNNPKFEDRNLRLAMSYGFNREHSLDQWYEGQGSLISGPYSPASSLHDPDVRPLPYDPDEAVRLLNESGYEDKNGDGILQSPSGEKLSFDILVRRTVGASELPAQNVAQDFVDNMREIGIEINLKSELSDNFQRIVHYDRDFELALIEWTFDPSYNAALLFHSDYIQPGGGNAGSFNSSEINELFDSLQIARQYRDRYRIASQIQRKLAEEAPHIFMFSVMKNAAIDLRFANVVIDPLHFFSYINRWEVIDD